jgi:hypothetical protein
MCALVAVVVWHEGRNQRPRGVRGAFASESADASTATAEHTQGAAERAPDIVAETLAPYGDPIDPVDLRRLIRILTQFARDISAGSVRRALLLPDDASREEALFPQRLSHGVEAGSARLTTSWSQNDSIGGNLYSRRGPHHVSAKTSSDPGTSHSSLDTGTAPGQPTWTETALDRPTGTKEREKMARTTATRTAVPSGATAYLEPGTREASGRPTEAVIPSTGEACELTREPVAVSYRAQASWHVVILDQNTPGDMDRSQLVAQRVLELLADIPDPHECDPEMLRYHVRQAVAEVRQSLT